MGGLSSDSSPSSGGNGSESRGSGSGPSNLGIASGHAGIGAAGVKGPPSLDGFSKEKDGRRYKLWVVQSPSRARMCGFGDKDRRPLSPILIVRLDVTEIATGKIVPPSTIDTSAFFLAADLVHPEDLKASPRNLLVHHHAPTVSPEAMQSPTRTSSGHETDSYQESSGIAVHDGNSRRSGSDPAYFGLNKSSQPQPQGNSHPLRSPSYPSLNNNTNAVAAPNGPTVATETYTRNFVGALVASANVLKDEKNQWGVFFVLSDLSVRTEGVYRIKVMFADLADGHSGEIKEGVSEALAEAYTEPFTVYTPRRFPGVIEPTPLSKKFASQGIKIPVRVDRKRRRLEDGEGGEDDEGEGMDGDEGDEAELR